MIFKPQYSRIMGSIRLRLIFAFTLITAMTVGSAVIAWQSVLKSKEGLDKVLYITVPIVSNSQILAKEVSSYIGVGQEFAHVTSEQHWSELSDLLNKQIGRFQSLIAEAYSFGFERKLLEEILSTISELEKNIQSQRLMSHASISLQEKLGEQIASLRMDFEEFDAIAQPKIVEGYSLFLIKGKRIGQEIKENLMSTDFESNEEKIYFLEKKFRVAFDTLINNAAGEMRANLEMIANIYLLTGLYYEASQVDQVGRIEELEKRADEVISKIKTLRLILSHSTPGNRKVLFYGLDLIDYGQGADSVFSLRKQELDLRGAVTAISRQNKGLYISLTDLTETLTLSSLNAAQRNAENIENELQRGQIFQVLAAISAILITIVFGWLYVDRRVINRIFRLRQVMDVHGKGGDVVIPVGGQDEISEMAGALKLFVEDQKTTEQQLRKSIQTLNIAQQIAKLGNCERDPRHKKWYWSDGFYLIIGYNKDDYAANEVNFWQIVHMDDYDRMHLFFSRLENCSDTLEQEFRVVTAGNSVRIIRASWNQSQQAESKQFSQSGTFQDITDRKLIEEELLRIRKLESIGVLAGGIAHDFNNLLTGILGNLSLAERMVSTDDKVAKSLSLAKKASLRARDLTAKLLTFADGGEPVRTVVFLSSMLKESVGIAIISENIECRYSLPENLWPLEMDAAQLNQIIQNLIINAEQAMDGTGLLEISCENCSIHDGEVNQLSAGFYVRIMVTDSGEGIDKSNLGKIFDPYFTTKERDSQKGSGLGLAIVHSIVAKHGGTIAVSSSVKEGSIFSLYLPAVPGEMAVVEEPVDDVLLGTGTILVMDDEDVVQNVARNMLEYLGYTVLQAYDGGEAIEMYREYVSREEIIDLVLMDLSVPDGMGGEEAVTILLKEFPEMKAVVSSGYATDPVMQNFSDYGFMGIAKKPYRLNELSTVVARVVGT